MVYERFMYEPWPTWRARLLPTRIVGPVPRIVQPPQRLAGIEIERHAAERGESIVC